LNHSPNADLFFNIASGFFLCTESAEGPIPKDAERIEPGPFPPSLLVLLFEPPFAGFVVRTLFFNLDYCVAPSEPLCVFRHCFASFSSFSLGIVGELGWKGESAFFFCPPP